MIKNINFTGDVNASYTFFFFNLLTIKKSTVWNFCYGWSRVELQSARKGDSSKEESTSITLLQLQLTRSTTLPRVGPHIYRAESYGVVVGVASHFKCDTSKNKKRGQVLLRSSGNGCTESFFFRRFSVPRQSSLSRPLLFHRRFFQSGTAISLSLLSFFWFPILNLPAFTAALSIRVLIERFPCFYACTGETKRFVVLGFLC